MHVADSGGQQDQRFSGPRHCPRCGYDQRGVLDTWKLDEPWPLDGTCSECGLLFAWLDVFRPERQRLKRFVEHSVGVRATGWAALWTTLWALLPSFFWKRVTLEAGVVPRRWGVWLAWTVGVPLAVYLLLASLLGLVRYVDAYGWIALTDPPVGTWISRTGETIRAIYLAGDASMWGPNFYLSFLLAAIWSGALVGAAMIPLVASTTMRRVKVRRVLILRAAVFSFAPVVVVATVRLCLCIIQLLGEFFDLNLTFEALLIALSPTQPWALQRYLLAGVFFIGIFGFAWIIRWWWMAMTRGWRIPAGWIVVQICFAQMVVSVLTAMAVVMYLPEFLR